MCPMRSASAVGPHTAAYAAAGRPHRGRMRRRWRGRRIRVPSSVKWTARTGVTPGRTSGSVKGAELLPTVTENVRVAVKPPGSDAVTRIVAAVTGPRRSERLVAILLTVSAIPLPDRSRGSSFQPTASGLRPVSIGIVGHATVVKLLNRSAVPARGASGDDEPWGTYRLVAVGDSRG